MFEVPRKPTKTNPLCPERQQKTFFFKRSHGSHTGPTEID